MEASKTKTLLLCYRCHSEYESTKQGCLCKECYKELTTSPAFSAGSSHVVQ